MPKPRLPQAHPRRMPLAELLPDVAGIPVSLEISGLVQDSREIRAGDAFVAIGGFGTHGLKFVDQARAANAAAILYEPPATADTPAPADAIAVPGLRSRMGAMADRFHDRPSAAMRVVGVTGTNGKTSTVQLLAQSWQLLGVRGASIGTLGVGFDGSLVPTGFTTPLVLKVHELLAGLRDGGATAVAMEVSSHALDQGRVDGVHFDVGVFTNLSRDHLDYHGDMETYAAAKARLLAWPGLQAAVVNLDDAHGLAMHSGLPATVHGIGVSSRGNASAAIHAADVRLDSHGATFELVFRTQQGEQRYAVRSALLGRFNVDNLLAVAGALLGLEVEPRDIAATLSQLRPIHGRMNRLGGTHGTPLVVVDFAHTPDALEQALASLRDHATGRLWCVFGCGGERDRGKRPQMAAIAQAGADAVVVTDDNPRHEDGDAIVADILAGFADPSGVVVLRDRAAAIAHAISHAAADDIVLIAGKGHEPDQDIAGVKHPFDDTQVARVALERRT
ncbi:UDP-N-acetylmuramoyl-L-alanyl-D-glutamate--2,6-diaminopimelate ligase [Novilysobacter antarcticus]|uniref:UDP-N-acetylmuramoyl-L-alanyl-D-glutamate--2, 6-diaminopimelate ligase n=1 Tax=Novilysobacter antarcticus TaxID=2862543 RepID=UPI001FE4B416|nr:UDP-N-acetylmuramoyl-L-alanyl-D-glutamate--2,6-diaminopimelate ligase [Lysobacter antarcticus]